MATLLLPPGKTDEQPPALGEATFVLVLSPIRSPEGRLRTVSHPLAPGQSVAEALPPGRYGRIIWNGAVLDEDQQRKVVLAPGDEVMAFPLWGDPFTGSLLLTFAIGLAISVAMTAINYFLFPPSKPHIEPPDPHTFSFEGIRTAIGPGNIKPVIYGRHRVGGQLLSASVTQAMTIWDNSVGGFHRVTAIDSPPTLDMLLGFGEGPIGGFWMDTCELNGQPLVDFPGVQTYIRLGTADQTPIPEFNEHRNTFADGRALPDNSANTGQEIVYTTTQGITAFVLNVVWNEGLFHVNGKGEKEVNTVNVAYRYKLAGAPLNTYSPYSVSEVAGERTAPVRLGIRREGLAMGVYDIAVNFGAIRHNDELKSKWQPTLESVTEIQGGTEAYPNTPLLGIRAMATDHFQGALPNLTVEINGRTVRVGTFAPGEIFGDNPAWCVLDLMTNTRYGMGIPDSDIDLAAFQVWADYCDELIGGERRHTFNYVLEREARSQALLMEMMGGSRALMLMSEGLYSPRVTRNDPPGPLFSWATCSNLQITYTRDSDRVNVMEARFANEESKFEQDVLVWPTVEFWGPEVHKASLEIRTVTKPSRIMRALQFELNRRQYENCSIEFDNALDAVTIQPHDLFRFSHPLPGWGESGRLQAGSTQTHLVLDHPVTMQAGVTYQVYLRYINDVTEARIVFNPGDTTTSLLDFGVPFSYTPVEDDTHWAFGTAAPEGAVRVFRAVKVERKSDATVHIQAVIHNPSIYDEPTAIPIPGTGNLPNALGVPPPLTALVATEITRIQPSGASLRVVNLAWAVATIGPGLAPYGGVKIYRRTVLLSSTAGNIVAGGIDLGAIQDPNDPNLNYVLLVQVKGPALETDDFTVVTGSTYLYRVVPVSGRDVPNEAGALTALIHVAGPTTPDFFPGTPRNLRLVGKAVGVTTWEGRDVHLIWDTVSDSPLYSETFYVNEYIVQVWAPGQEYLLRSTNTGGVLGFTYTFSMNQEDHLRAGIAGAQRDLLFVVYAKTNTGRLSLDPATLTVHNPPPDMSNIQLDAGSLGGTAIISWNQFVEPIDFDHYELHLDTMTPPIAIYEDYQIGFHGVGLNNRKVFVLNLPIGVTYYTFALPYDTFGPGTASQITSFVIAGIDAASIDSTPPGVPTNLVLTTGTETSADGTIMPWVEASWTLAPESDVAGYEVHVYAGTNPAPTVWNPIRAQHSIRFYVPGHTTVRVKLLAFDKFHNISDFSAEATITTAGDTVAPGLPSNLTAIGSIKSVALLWTPPADVDYDHCEVWSAASNNLNAAGQRAAGTGKTSFVHEGLGANETRWYWIRAVDTSGNLSGFFPVSTTAGVPGTAGQLDTTYISSLAANKLIAGTITALVNIGVNQIELDGVNHLIGIRDPNTSNYRVLLGRQGPLGTQEWGLRIFNAAGQTMWNLTDGATTEGITNAAVTAAKIRAGSIESQHLITNTAVITFAAQIANAIIADAHITSLAANKITAGTILAQLLVGIGSNIAIDGVNKQIRILDTASVLRVLIGHVPPDDWSIQIYNAQGVLMWDPLQGALTPGIAPAAVITEKIYPNAVTATLLYGDFVGGPLAVGSAEIEVGRLTFGELQAGDQVKIDAKMDVVLDNLATVSNIYYTLREDSVSGGVHDQGWARMQPDMVQVMYVHTLYNVPALMFNKVFIVTIYAQGASHVHFQGTRIIGMRTQR